MRAQATGASGHRARRRTLPTRSAAGLAVSVLLILGGPGAAYGAGTGAGGSDDPPGSATRSPDTDRAAPAAAPRLTAADSGKANAQILNSGCAVPESRNASIIETVYSVATGRRVSDKVLLAAFEAGWVESHLNNLRCGDQDSLGVFQQRPSQGWGSPAQLLDPVYATNAFLNQAVPNDRAHPSWSAGQLAQSVQRSAYPDRYDQNRALALDLILEAQDAVSKTRRAGSAGTVEGAEGAESDAVRAGAAGRLAGR